MKQLAFFLATLASCTVLGQEPSSGLQVQDFTIPEHLAWNTNVLSLAVRNADAVERKVTIDVQTRVGGSGGVGWQSSAAIGPGETKPIERDFFLRPLPGPALVQVRITDASSGNTIWYRELHDDFPVYNERRNAVRISNPAIWRLSDATIAPPKESYPPLRLERVGRFAFYFVPGDTYAEQVLPAIARTRSAVLADLERTLKTRLDHPIAFYFFPDQPTKFAYTLHRGEGWAVGGTAILEVLNETQQLDPNHELVHIIASQIGNPPALMNEGMATYLQEHHQWHGYAMDCWCQSFSRAHMLFPLAELLERDEIGSDESRPGIAYPQAASVVGFLIEEFGWKRFRQAYHAVKNSGQQEIHEGNRQQLETIYARTLQQIETQWKSRVSRARCRKLPPAARIEEIRLTGK